MADEATEEVNIATIFENIETTMVDIMTPLNALIGRHHIEFGSLHHRKRICFLWSSYFGITSSDIFDHL